MRFGCRLLILSSLALASGAARADILLPGHQHVGDCRDELGDCPGFTPLDPMARNHSLNTMLKFHLTAPTTTLTGLRLNGLNPASLGNDRRLQISIQPLGAPRMVQLGTFSGITFTLQSALSLSPGYYSIGVDGGCDNTNNDDPATFFYPNCDKDEPPDGINDGDNDFGYSSVTLLSAEASTSRMFNQRRHLGDGNDSEDDYDVSGTPQLYPDIREGLTLDLGFTLDVNRRLTSVAFYRLREVSTDSSIQGRVLVDGTQIGLLTQNAMPPAPFTITTNQSLLAGSHTLRITMPDPGDANDISWDDIILGFDAPPGVPGSFNAVDTGENAVTGPLRTKIAAGDPQLQIVALNSLRTDIDTGYTGAVTVQLMDATVGGVLDPASGCEAGWTPVPGQSTVLTFVAGDNGRKALPAPFFNTALRKARLRITDEADAVGCSTDRFALRPARFTVNASHGDELTAGGLPLNNALTSGLPRHKAGRPFRVTVAAVNADSAVLTGYSGTPLPTHQRLAPAANTGALALPLGALVNGLAVTDTATYSEVGSFTLTLRDDTFSEADEGDTLLANRRIEGIANVGRFIPDHFEVSNLRFTAGCNGVFTYAGQPMSASGTLTAMAFADPTPFTKTSNYTGDLYKFSVTPLFKPAPTTYQPAASLNPGLPIPDAELAPGAPGEASLTLTGLRYRRPAAPVAPFSVDIQATVNGVIDSDLVVLSQNVFGGTAPGTGIPFTGPPGSESQRFGRLYIQPRFGSELAPITNIPLRAEYWDGAGFVTSTDDTCTILVPGDITAENLAPAPPAQPPGQTLALAGAGPGAWNANLTAPGDVRKVTLSIDLALPFTDAVLYPWLQAANDPDGFYDDDPLAVIEFGLFNSNDRRIFQREVVR